MQQNRRDRLHTKAQGGVVVGKSISETHNHSGSERPKWARIYGDVCMMQYLGFVVGNICNDNVILQNRIKTLEVCNQKSWHNKTQEMSNTGTDSHKLDYHQYLKPDSHLLHWPQLVVVEALIVQQGVHSQQNSNGIEVVLHPCLGMRGAWTHHHMGTSGGLPTTAVIVYMQHSCRLCSQNRSTITPNEESFL